MNDLVGYRRPDPATQPSYLEPRYVSTMKRAPTQPLVPLPHTLSEVTGPVFTAADIPLGAFDLTKRHAGEPLGERIIVSGRVLDEDGAPMSNTLIEIWQANAAGRYRHDVDNHDAPLDPNFTGCGQMLTGREGEYRFVTIKPGAYPWRNHANAWRPSHIHFSVFGPSLCTRLVTQMYFPGDPLLEFDPMFMSIADEPARLRLISTLDWQTTVPEFALSYRFDIILRGRDRTPADPVISTPP